MSVARLMRSCLCAAAAFLLAPPPVSAAGSEQFVIVRGADGSPDYKEGFDDAGKAWEDLCQKAGVPVVTVRGKDEMKRWLSQPDGGEEEGADAAARLWVVLVGHGTFDGREAKFNLEGEDVAAGEVAGWTAGLTRPLVFINTTASSAPFLPALSRGGWVVITATKDGSEASYAHFGKYFVEAIGSPGADIDKDGATSVLEAFIVASRGVKAFFDEEGRIASEEALLDDNGDGKGVRARHFNGVVSAVKPGRGTLPDGVRAHQISLVPNPEEAGRSDVWKQGRDRLELEVFKLRVQRETLQEEAYYDALEEAVKKLAEHYESPGA